MKVLNKILNFDDSNQIFRIDFEFNFITQLEYSNSFIRFILKIESLKFESNTRLKIEFSTRRDQFINESSSKI